MKLNILVVGLGKKGISYIELLYKLASEYPCFKLNVFGIDVYYHKREACKKLFLKEPLHDKNNFCYVFDMTDFASFQTTMDEYEISAVIIASERNTHDTIIENAVKCGIRFILSDLPVSSGSAGIYTEQDRFFTDLISGSNEACVFVESSIRFSDTIGFYLPSHVNHYLDFHFDQLKLVKGESHWDMSDAGEESGHDVPYGDLLKLSDGFQTFLCALRFLHYGAEKVVVSRVQVHGCPYSSVTCHASLELSDGNSVDFSGSLSFGAQKSQKKVTLYFSSKANEEITHEARFYFDVPCVLDDDNIMLGDRMVWIDHCNPNNNSVVCTFNNKAEDQLYVLLECVFNDGTIENDFALATLREGILLAQLINGAIGIVMNR